MTNSNGGSSQIPQMPRPIQRPANNLSNQPGNFDPSQTFNGNSGFSEQEKIQRSVAKGKKNAHTLQTVIAARSELEKWLAYHGLKLVTSSVELQFTRNFINSSYVDYPNGTRVKLALFLQQVDPVIQELALQINNNITNVAAYLEITSKPVNQNFNF